MRTPGVVVVALLAIGGAGFLTGCASGNAYWPSYADQPGYVQGCSKDQKVQYGPEGHCNTTDLIAKIAGLDPYAAARLAYFSQAPDAMWFAYSAPAVGVWGFVPPFWSYRSRIVNTLHSLHGGDHSAMVERRQRLQDQIISHRSRKEPDWKVGFLIHALGDSYAHVHGKDAEARAYGEFVGHIFDNGEHGERPDVIVVNEHYKIYNEYVTKLFEALVANGAGGDRDALRAYTAAVEAKVKSGIKNEEFIKFIRGYPYCPRTSSPANILKGQCYATMSSVSRNDDAPADWDKEIHFFEVGEFLSGIAKEL